LKFSEIDSSGLSSVERRRTMLKVLLGLLAVATGVQCQSSIVNDAACDRQLAYFDAALENREDWAIFVFDTWAKLQSSVLRGNLDIPGGFTDCVNFRHDSNVSAVGIFQGMHCMVRFRPTLNASEIGNEGEGRLDWREM
jgi:hypothetical protein